MRSSRGPNRFMRDDIALLRDMLDYAETAISFVNGRDRRDLDSDRMLYLALIRALEVIGEAASQVSSAGRASFNDLPWQQMIGMRNRLIHAYIAVNADIVWNTTVNSLPPLIAALNRILADAGPATGDGGATSEER
jgi:uncharacterized protein with HEPN domain